MKKQVKLPSGLLGHIPSGTINIDLELKAKHYDDLTTSTGDHTESVVLSILKDLMEEDPYLLTQNDLLYVFTLVKISSIGSTLKITVKCPSLLKLPTGLQRVCGSKITVGYSLAKDDDVVYYKAKDRPQFIMEINDRTETFAMQLPTMASELALLEEYENQGITREQLLKDKKTASEYAKKRMLLHLVTNQYTQEELYTALNEGPFSRMNDLAEKVKELSVYGLRHKVLQLTCPDCGGTFEYHLPLFAGLSV